MSKKRASMAVVSKNTAKTTKTSKTTGFTESSFSDMEYSAAKRKQDTVLPKTPVHIRHRIKYRIAKVIDENSETDFSAEENEFVPTESERSTSSDCSSYDVNNHKPKTQFNERQLKTPSVASLRQKALPKSVEYVPESDVYFRTYSNNKIQTSNFTLHHIKHLRLPADRIFTLLADKKTSTKHELFINNMMKEYRTCFYKWMVILNEGFNVLLYGLGSKRQLLQCFHREILGQQTVLVINGFFPSLDLKDVIDSITKDILDFSISPMHPQEAVDIIEEEFSLIPNKHLYLIIHNLDGVMLRSEGTQSSLARLAKVRNIHLLASIDHSKTPIFWDHFKLSNFNFSWWDCTTMLPYQEETVFENSVLVQNSAALALSSMRNVVSALTTNAHNIYMLIVKYQLKNKSNMNYQGMSFKDLYWSCREGFLVSSDLALRSQLTEFIDHKLVKFIRSIEGTEHLTIPIDSNVLQQFSDEWDTK